MKKQTKEVEQFDVATFDDLLADSEPEQDTVTIGDRVVRVQELSGAARFHVAEMPDDDQWSMMKFIAYHGMVEPKPASEDDLDRIKPSWVIKIAKKVGRLSGITEEEIEAAGKESANVSAIGSS